MSSIYALCIQLGFDPSKDKDIVPKPDPRFASLILENGQIERLWRLRSAAELESLLQEVGNFIQKYTFLTRNGDVALAQLPSWPEEVSKMTGSFLCQGGVAEKHWKNRSPDGPSQGPQWPRDKGLIEELLTDLIVSMAHDMGSPSHRNTDRMDLRKVTKSAAPPRGDVSIPAGTPPADVKGKIIDLEDYVPSNGDKSTPPAEGSTALQDVEEPRSRTPIEFASDEELKAALKSWRQRHDNAHPSGTYKNGGRYNNKPKDSRPVMTGLGVEGVERIIIDKDCGGWVLRRANGKVMLVQALKGGCYYASYSGWLGEDFGFSKHVVTQLHHTSSSFSTPTSRQPELASSHQEEKKSPTVSGNNLQQAGNGFQKAEPGSLVEEDAAYRNTRALKRKIPKLSGQQSHVLAKTPKMSHTHSSSTSGAHSTILHNPLLLLSSRLRNSADILSVSPLGLNEQKSGLNLNHDLAHSRRPTSPLLNAKFHFFGSDPTLGAVLETYEGIRAANKFFETAHRSWQLTATNEEPTRSMSAVAVSWSGGRWPIMVPWNDEDGFRRMVIAIEKAKAVDGGEIDVEVKCITKDT